MSYFLLKIEQFQFPSFHRAWHQEDGRDRAVPYLKNASSGDFQHSNQFKFEEKYLSKHSNIHKGKQTSFLAKVNSRCFFLFPAAMLVCLRGTPTWRLHTKPMNLCGTFCQITWVWNTSQTWHLDRFLIYLSSITCQFLDFIHGMVSIFFSMAWQWKPAIWIANEFLLSTLTDCVG